MVSLLLIASRLTPELQGYYYTFGSLMALQSFFELGFYVVITQFASHEWANLGLNQRGFIVGQETSLSRLVSLGHLILKWYTVASGLFVAGVGGAGYFFLSSSSLSEIAWQGPWLCAVCFTGIQLWFLPIISLLEGCNQVAKINLFRFIQSVSSNCCMWLALMLGFRLWIAPVWTGAGVFVMAFLIAKEYRNFFSSFYLASDAHIPWKSEIWPMQWRLALLGIVNYLFYSLFTPVMFRYHGPIVAGQMGMTWVMAGAIGSVGSSWMVTKIPTFGMLVARKQYKELDRVFIRSFLSSLGVVCFGVVVVWTVVLLLNFIKFPLATRMLPPLATGLFLIATVLMHISFCGFTYLRAHKMEPLVWVGCFSSILIGVFVWLLGSRYGPIGAACAFLGVILTVLFPWGTVVGLRCRRTWHGIK